MDDLALTRRVLAGEEAAFDALFAEYFPRLFRFAVARLGGDQDAAEEVVQSTLIRALRKLHTYRGEAALFTWLCTICRHEIATIAHRTGRANEVALAEDRPAIRAALEALARDASADLENSVRRQELGRLVQLTLDHLPARYGDALRWKYLDEEPVDEIARRLDVGYKAAESLLVRARAAFREGFTLAAGLPEES